MAVIGNKFFDLIDLYSRQNSTRDIATIIEMLAETNEVLSDATAVECNDGTSHLTTIRTGLPEVTWGQLYKGVEQDKSETAQVRDATGFVEGLSTVDERLLQLSDNPNQVRLTEAQGFLESLSQEAAEGIFYANQATDPERFTGLTPRFNDATAANGGQIVDGGGSSNLTSIWVVTWGDRQTQLIYPQGTSAGINREDKGSQRVLDGDGNPYYAREEMFRWHLGLTVRDWQFVSRVANVDVDQLQSGATDIYPLLRKAFWKIKRHRVSGGRMAIYANADVLEALDAQSTPTASTDSAVGTATNVRLTPRNVDGREVLTYRGIPVRQVDALHNDEDQVDFS